MKFSFSALLFVIPFVSGRMSMHRHVTRKVDTTALVGQYQSVTAGQYSLLNNLWDKHNATTGSQTSQLTSLSGTNIAWKTSWTWTGGPIDVKSFSNIQLNQGINQQLSAISSMPVSRMTPKANGVSNFSGIIVYLELVAGDHRTGHS